MVLCEGCLGKERASTRFHKQQLLRGRKDSRCSALAPGLASEKLRAVKSVKKPKEREPEMLLKCFLEQENVSSVCVFWHLPFCRQR